MNSIMSFRLDLVCMKHLSLMRTVNLRVLYIQCKLKIGTTDLLTKYISFSKY